jgi:hypothetical protein
MSDERIFGHDIDVASDLSGRCVSGTSQASETPCEAIPCAVLLLLAMLANAMNQVSSTIAAGPSRFEQPEYARCAVVCLGREFYELALANPVALGRRGTWTSWTCCSSPAKQSSGRPESMSSSMHRSHTRRVRTPRDGRIDDVTFRPRLPRRRQILASGRRAEVRRSRSHASAPQGRPRRGGRERDHGSAGEDGTVQHRPACRVSLA